MIQRDVSTAAIYDAFAGTYDASRDQFDLTDVLADFDSQLGDTGDLLDLGCGAGEPVGKHFLAQGWTVTGVDESPAMLELAGSHVPEMTRINADMRAVDLPANAFDAITAIYSLFHVPWVEHPTLFASMHRWLRPHGKILFTYATASYTGHDRFNGTKNFMGQDLFYSHATPAELRAQLEDAGFDSLDLQDRTIGGESFLWVTATKRS